MLDTRVEAEPDFILLKRFQYSMAALLKKYPDGCPDPIIAQALGISVEEVEVMFQAAALKIRAILQDASPGESILS